LKVILRKFNPDSDTGLIYDSYPKGVWARAVKKKEESKKEWMTQFFTGLQRQLKECDVNVACIEDDPDHIAGYSIISKKRELHFVYVKEIYRNKRIGSLLTRGKFDSVNPDTLTILGEKIYGRKESPDVASCSRDAPIEKINEPRESSADDRSVD